jgi:hypothetical protein
MVSFVQTSFDQRRSTLTVVVSNKTEPSDLSKKYLISTVANRNMDSCLIPLATACSLQSMQFAFLSQLTKKNELSEVQGFGISNEIGFHIAVDDCT